ncbi:MAG: c4-dicarboxylate-binding periplasmic protein [Pseudomonadota bacterium]
MKRRDVLKAGAALGTISGFPAVVRAQAKVTMRLSHQLPTGHHMHKIYTSFADAAKAESKGEIEVQIFPAEQAAKANENHPAVARGAIEAAGSVNFQWGNTIPETSVTVIPYLLPQLARIKKWAGSEARAMLDAKSLQRGVRNIAWFYLTRQSIYTSNKAPLLKPADFKGLKVRGLNRLFDQSLVAVGAAPSALPGPEVYQALQSGVLDAGMTDVSAAVSRRFYEVQKFGTVAPNFTVFFQTFVNPKWWDALSADHRGAIERAVQKTDAAAFDVTEATATDAVKQLREKGMTVHMQTDAEIAEWTAAMQKPVIDEFLKTAGADGQKIIDLVAKL